MSRQRSPDLPLPARKARFGDRFPHCRERGVVDFGYSAFPGKIALEGTIRLCGG